MFEDNCEIAVNPVGTPEEKEKQITFSLSAFRSLTKGSGREF